MIHSGGMRKAFMTDGAKGCKMALECISHPKASLKHKQI
jgi:hypothetical protein